MWFILAQHPFPILRGNHPPLGKHSSTDLVEAYDLASAEPSSGASGLYTTDESNTCLGHRDLFRGRPVT